MNVAIDASNIRAGGGVTHLKELLAASSPDIAGFRRVLLFGGSETLNRIADQPWLEKRTFRVMNSGQLARMLWRDMALSKAVYQDADILLVPGGSYSGSFRPFVALAQNLLPFDPHERAREGMTLKRLRLHLLEKIQTRTFRRANGVIYMTEISKTQIEYKIGFQAKPSRVIYHGTGSKFYQLACPQPPSSAFSLQSPFRLLYVSILESYKHQDVVIDAVADLRRRGIPVALDLIGPGDAASQKQTRNQIAARDPAGAFLRYLGPQPYDQLSQSYKLANAFVFASSCETFGIILLEAMAAGLPVICSHRSAIPEVVGSAAAFFDPESRSSLAGTILATFKSQSMRRSLSFQSREQAARFSWEKCANDTFGFVREVYLQHSKSVITCAE